jgi:hypothetical protein
MRSNDGNGARHRQTRRYIDSLYPDLGDRAGFVQFSRWDATTDTNLSPSLEGIANHHPITGSDLDAVGDGLRDWSRGGTNISRGISTALDLYERNPSSNDRVLIVLTDGQNDGGEGLDAGGQGHPGEHAKESGRCTSNGRVRPLALGLDSQVSPAFLEGNLQLPAQNEPLNNLSWCRMGISAQKGLGLKFL